MWIILSSVFFIVVTGFIFLLRGSLKEQKLRNIHSEVNKSDKAYEEVPVKKYNRLKRLRIIKAIYLLHILLFIPYGALSYTLALRFFSKGNAELIMGLPFIISLMFCHIYILTFACPRCEKSYGKGRKCGNCDLSYVYDKELNENAEITDDL